MKEKLVDRITLWMIERERADLSVQLIALTDRLEDAEGTTDSQVSPEIYIHQYFCSSLWFNSIAS
ncbi:unnamed protein product [Strongylus vulgaris]|uniref:Uncharacterized protein n=1 Tax=Strongylus vulgaris TaxID=40348 RepID=A0A3P7JIY8_STRVU|nr:unnamed protein product [Strongylus vulgaris]